MCPPYARERSEHLDVIEPPNDADGHSQGNVSATSYGVGGVSG